MFPESGGLESARRLKLPVRSGRQVDNKCACAGGVRRTRRIGAMFSCFLIIAQRPWPELSDTCCRLLRAICLLKTFRRRASD